MSLSFHRRLFIFATCALISCGTASSKTAFILTTSPTPREEVEKPEGLIPKAAIGDFDVNYGPHFDNMVAILQEAERQRAGFVQTVGIQIFDKHQAKIDAFLASGNTAVLLDTRNDPDLEVLGGHFENEATRNGFLRFFEGVYRINQSRRGDKIKIVAIDKAPSATQTFAQWRETHSDKDYRNWLLMRDADMFNKIKDEVAANARRIRFTVVFTQPMHVLKSGAIRFYFPRETPATIDVVPLGVRLKRQFEDVIVVHQNNPTDACVDKIEAQLFAQGVREDRNIELKNNPLGQTQNFRCEKEYPYLYFYQPNPYYAKDHYDNYAFLPKP